MDEWHIEADKECVRAWSNFRLPFEPKGPRREFRDEIRAALRGLAPGSRELHGCYTSAELSPCDAENLLLYNVGEATFRPLALEALSFERQFGPVAPDPGGRVWQHLSTWQTGPAEATHWRATAELAELGGAGTWSLPANATDVWIAMRQGWSTLRGTLPAGNTYAVDATLTAPRLPGDVVNRTKLLLDGIIAALHVHDGRDLTTVAARLGRRAGTTPAEAQRLLTCNDCAPLGERRLVWPFGQGYQWNPGDDLCVRGRVQFKQGDGKAWSATARTYEVEAAGAEGD